MSNAEFNIQKISHESGFPFDEEGTAVTSDDTRKVEQAEYVQFEWRSGLQNGVVLSEVGSDSVKLYPDRSLIIQDRSGENEGEPNLLIVRPFEAKIGQEFGFYTPSADAHASWRLRLLSTDPD